MTQKPKFTVADFISGKFSDNLESYLTDQVPLRDGWVTMKTYMELTVGKRESGGVYICKDKYLMDKFTSYSKKQLASNAATLVDLQEKLAAEGISMNMILVPMAAQVLTDKLPAHAPVADYTAILQVLTDAGVDTTDVFFTLAAHSSENIYYRTDHHWATRGAFLAYQALLTAQGETPLEERDFRIETVSEDFFGTLYSKANLPLIPADTIEAYLPEEENPCTVTYDGGKTVRESLYDPSYLEGRDKYAYFLGGNHPLTEITTSVRNGRRLLVIKDSYAHALVPFLTAHYETIDMVDLRYFKEDLAAWMGDRGITDVLVLYNASTFASDRQLAAALS